MMRTKWLVGCVAVTAVALAVPAQAEAQAQFGIKAGIALAQVRGDLPIDNDLGDFTAFGRGTAFTGGAFVAIPVAAGFSIQPEALYQKRKTTLDFSALEELVGETVDAWVEVDYIEVPVLLKWQAASGSVRPVIFGGPSLAFRMGAKAKITAMGESEEEDLKDDIKGTDFGLVIGAGLGFGKFGIEGRYNVGLSNIAVDAPDSIDFKWGTWSFLGSVTF